MADIKPFVCVRPAEDVVSAVAALPYDVYNREEAKEVVAKNPKSFLAIEMCIRDRCNAACERSKTV